MGYLPEALNNYLLRLGWSHGDDEIINREQAIEWFNTDSIGKAPARIDFDKMANTNAHYLKQADNQRLLSLILPLLDNTENPIHHERILHGMDGLKDRAKTINELAEGSKIYLSRLPYTEKAFKLVNEEGPLISRATAALEAVNTWDLESIKPAIKAFCEAEGMKMGKVLPPVRAAVCGTMEAPGLFDVLLVLGKDEVLARLQNLG
jgi:glutamyl-tRNA synthetase